MKRWIQGFGTLFAALALFCFLNVAAFAGGQVGEEAPNFVLPNTEEAPVELNGFRGKAVVLAFYRGQW